ncbi:cell wall hydrolase [Sphingomonas sp.]|uniref:cell wall hydrolase n=1 Tax=Sphingomonas sp. TaxID=28214 RepID=UPI00286BF6C8|nr:cell wall hydrolase [Sphingomonas sp.]
MMIPLNSAVLPQTVVPQILSVDPARPAQTVDTADSQSDELVPLPAKPTGDLASMVAQLRASEAGSHELNCLAVGIYFESKSEPLSGQLAVGDVIANRANSKGRFPPSYCGVLFQRGQFSFVRGHALPAVPRASRQWQTAVAIAQIVDRDLKASAAPRALFFHARRVSPGWKLTRVASIGNHIFYR